MKVIVINGAPCSGKDTFANMCITNNTGAGTIISMADAAKDVARYCGWNGEKTPKNRKFLSDLKDLLDNWGDTSFKNVEKFIDALFEIEQGVDNWIVFVMSREPKDIERLKRRFNAYTIYISNYQAEKEPATNHADADIKCFTYDEYISNNSTLDELELKSKDFVERIMKNGFDYRWN